jgi:hypothetical protein
MEVLCQQVVPWYFKDEGVSPQQAFEGGLLRRDVCALLTSYWKWRKSPEPARLYLAVCTLFENMFRARKRQMPTYFDVFGKALGAPTVIESIVRPLPHTYIALLNDGVKSGKVPVTFTDTFKQTADYISDGLFSTSSKAKHSKTYATMSPMLPKAQRIIAAMDGFYNWMNTVYDLSDNLGAERYSSTTQKNVHHFSRKKLAEKFYASEFGKRAESDYGRGRYTKAMIGRILWYRLCGQIYRSSDHRLHLRLREQPRYAIFKRTGMLAELYEREKQLEKDIV